MNVVAFKQEVNTAYLVTKDQVIQWVEARRGGVCIQAIVFLRFGPRETKTKM